MTERRSGQQRKDRLIQTRVPQDLESTLKDEARKRRLSVSHLIRNVLEDTFHLVDNVVVEVDRVVSDGRHMAQTLRRDAERLRATALGDDAGTDEAVAGESPHPESPPDGSGEADLLAATAEAAASEPAASEPEEAPPEDAPPGGEPGAHLSHVYAWQPVVLNRQGDCAKCGRRILKGDEAHMGLSDRPGARAWLCGTCVQGL